MTPPRQPPRPALHLAENPPPTPRRTLDEVDQAAKATAERVDALGSVVGMTAARVEVLTHDHDEEANETVATVRRIEARQIEHGEAIQALARGAEAAWTEAGLARDELRALGNGLADLQAALILRDVEAERRAKSIAITAGKEASKGAESRGAKTATAALTALGAVLWAAVQVIKLLQGA